MDLLVEGRGGKVGQFFVMSSFEFIVWITKFLGRGG
jgi:hypothetical protein